MIFQSKLLHAAWEDIWLVAVITVCCEIRKNVQFEEISLIASEANINVFLEINSERVGSEEACIRSEEKGHYLQIGQEKNSQN